MINAKINGVGGGAVSNVKIYAKIYGVKRGEPLATLQSSKVAIPDSTRFPKHKIYLAMETRPSVKNILHNMSSIPKILGTQISRQKEIQGSS